MAGLFLVFQDNSDYDGDGNSAESIIFINHSPDWDGDGDFDDVDPNTTDLSGNGIDDVEWRAGEDFRLKLDHASHVAFKYLDFYGGPGRLYLENPDEVIEGIQFY